MFRFNGSWELRGQNDALEAIFMATGLKPAFSWSVSDFSGSALVGTSVIIPQYCGVDGINCDREKYVTAINLNGKNLVGELPDVFNNFPRLKKLNLSNNQLFGSIPTSLSQSSSLQHLDLGYNSFSGYIPDFSSAEMLETLALEHNSFHGELPKSLCELHDLIRLHVSSLGLSGSIPNCLGSLSVLSTLVISDSGLTGTIPSKLCSRREMNGLSPNEFGCAAIGCPEGFVQFTDGRQSSRENECLPCSVPSNVIASTLCRWRHLDTSTAHRPQTTAETDTLFSLASWASFTENPSTMQTEEALNDFSSRTASREPESYVETSLPSDSSTAEYLSRSSEPSVPLSQKVDPMASTVTPFLDTLMQQTEIPLQISHEHSFHGSSVTSHAPISSSTMKTSIALSQVASSIPSVPPSQNTFVMSTEVSYVDSDIPSPETFAGSSIPSVGSTSILTEKPSNSPTTEGLATPGPSSIGAASQLSSAHPTSESSSPTVHETVAHSFVLHDNLSSMPRILPTATPTDVPSGSPRTDALGESQSLSPSVSHGTSLSSRPTSLRYIDQWRPSGVPGIAATASPSSLPFDDHLGGLVAEHGAKENSKRSQFLLGIPSVMCLLVLTALLLVRKRGAATQNRLILSRTSLREGAEETVGPDCEEIMNCVGEVNDDVTMDNQSSERKEEKSSHLSSILKRPTISSAEGNDEIVPSSLLPSRKVRFSLPHNRLDWIGNLQAAPVREKSEEEIDEKENLVRDAFNGRSTLASWMMTPFYDISEEDCWPDCRSNHSSDEDIRSNDECEIKLGNRNLFSYLESEENKHLVDESISPTDLLALLGIQNRHGEWNDGGSDSEMVMQGTSPSNNVDEVFRNLRNRSEMDCLTVNESNVNDTNEDTYDDFVAYSDFGKGMGEV